MRRAWLSLVLVPVLAGCFPATGRWVEVDPVFAAARTAIVELGKAPGLRYRGDSVDVRVTGAGEAVGTISHGGRRAELLVVDGGTYVRGGKEIWGGDDRADAFAGRWVAANDNVGPPVLTPEKLAAGLTEQFITGHAPAPASGPPAESTIAGVRAWRLSVAGGDLYVSVEEPHRILRVDAPLEGERVRLDVAPETEDSLADVISGVAAGAGVLASGKVYDARVRISFVGKLNVPCGGGGCNVSAVVRNDSSAQVSVVFTANVTSNGRALASCASAPKPIAVAKTAPFGCQAGGAVWSTFYQRATRPSRTPTTTPYLVRAVAVATAKPPVSVECSVTGKARPPASCPKPTITDRGVSHSFDEHAREWWGRDVQKSVDLPAWREMIETAHRSGQRFPWNSRNRLTTAHLARVDGRYFVAQFDRNTGELVTAFGPRPAQVRAMLRALGK
jgi:hypothetical protein